MDIGDEVRITRYPLAYTGLLGKVVAIEAGNVLLALITNGRDRFLTLPQCALDKVKRMHFGDLREGSLFWELPCGFRVSPYALQKKQPQKVVDTWMNAGRYGMLVRFEDNEIVLVKVE